MPCQPPPTSTNFLALSLPFSCEKLLSNRNLFTLLELEFPSPTMKKPGLFAASVAAASATAISTSCPCSSSSIYNTQQEAELKQNQENQRPSSTEKFAPRFDGLRFIETLVTAHR